MRPRAIGSLVALTAVVGACRAIIGYDSVTYEPSDGAVSPPTKDAGHDRTVADGRAGKEDSGASKSSSKESSHGSSSGSSTASSTASSAASSTASSTSSRVGDAGPPSCAQGGPATATCRTDGGSCCTSLEIEGGVYDRTYTNTGGGPTAGSDPASVTGLRLDEYLVTVGRFRPFVEAVKPTDAGPAGWTPSHASGKHTHLNHGKGLVALGVGVDAGSGVDAAGVDAGATFYEPGWDPADDVHLAPTDGNLTCGKYATWTSAAGAQEDLPINCTNWYEAYAFCIWDGGFLPSEAEWEYTAAGGSEELEYPWGSVDAGTTNRYAIYGCYYPSGLGTCTGVGNIAPVGTPPDGEGRWGQRDMAGELWEWTLDWYAAAYGNPCIDCAYLGTSTTKVIRGGGYGLGADNMVPPYRHDNAPTVRGFGNGFRCARVP